MTEKQLRPIVETFLQDTWGLYVAHEVMLCGYCDIIGCRWAERVGRRKPKMLQIVAVELKIKDIVGVLSQAKGNCHVADYSYAAMPLDFYCRMRKTSVQKFRDAGVGLIGVTDTAAMVIQPAARNAIKHNPLICNRLWNFKLRHARKQFGANND